MGMPHRNTPPLRFDPIERPPVEHVPTYEDQTRLFKVMIELMAERYASACQESLAVQKSEPASLDLESRVEGRVDAPESLEDLVDALWTPLQAAREIEAAMDQQAAAEQPDPYQDEMQRVMDSYWNAQPPATQPGPYQEQQQMYDEEMRVMDPFAMPGPGPMM